MPDITSLEMLLRSLIVALPLLVLTVLFFLLAAKRRAPHEAAHPPVEAPQRSSPRPPESAPVAQRVQEADLPARPMQPAALTVEQAAGTVPAAPPPAPPPSAPSHATVIAGLEADIARAEEAGATVELAELYLALGRAHMADGAEGEALSALRSAAGLAALHKAPKVQAQARLELADVAMSHGDPTTACEHWQMARMAFLESGARVDADKIDRRMRAQGCPTDWVLTDF